MVDVTGWFTTCGGTTGGAFNVVTPARICDTRAPEAGSSSDVAKGVSGICESSGTALGAGGTAAVQVAGLAGVPVGAAAVVLSVTAVDTTAASYLSIYPAGVARPTVSNLNWAAGEATSNLVVVSLRATGNIEVFNHMGTTHLVIDVEDWYS
ncbi:MAG: hypothetical protein ACYCTL_02140 [Acidimicrobiales bacterium]